MVESIKNIPVINGVAQIIGTPFKFAGNAFFAVGSVFTGDREGFKNGVAGVGDSLIDPLAGTFNIAKDTIGLAIDATDAIRPCRAKVHTVEVEQGDEAPRYQYPLVAEDDPEPVILHPVQRPATNPQAPVASATVQRPATNPQPPVAPAPVQKQDTNSQSPVAPAPVQRQDTNSQSPVAPAPVQRQDTNPQPPVASAQNQNTESATNNEQPVVPAQNKAKKPEPTIAPANYTIVQSNKTDWAPWAIAGGALLTATIAILTRGKGVKALNSQIDDFSRIVNSLSGKVDNIAKEATSLSGKVDNIANEATFANTKLSYLSEQLYKQFTEIKNTIPDLTEGKLIKILTKRDEKLYTVLKDKAGNKKLGEMTRKLLAAIKENKGLSANDVAKIVSSQTDEMQNAIKALEAKNLSPEEFKKGIEEILNQISTDTAVTIKSFTEMKTELKTLIVQNADELKKAMPDFNQEKLMEILLANQQEILNAFGNIPDKKVFGKVAKKLIATINKSKGLTADDVAKFVSFKTAEIKALDAQNLSLEQFNKGVEEILNKITIDTAATIKEFNTKITNAVASKTTVTPLSATPQIPKETPKPVSYATNSNNSRTYDSVVSTDKADFTKLQQETQKPVTSLGKPSVSLRRTDKANFEKLQQQIKNAKVKSESDMMGVDKRAAEEARIKNEQIDLAWKNQELQEGITISFDVNNWPKSQTTTVIPQKTQMKKTEVILPQPSSNTQNTTITYKPMGTAGELIPDQFEKVEQALNLKPQYTLDEHATAYNEFLTTGLDKINDVPLIPGRKYEISYTKPGTPWHIINKNPKGLSFLKDIHSVARVGQSMEIELTKENIEALLKLDDPNLLNIKLIG